MIEIREMHLEEVSKIKEIDRSEYIESIYRMNDGELVQEKTGHECGAWEEQTLNELEQRYTYELKNGGKAIGAYDGVLLVGFGVLAHQFRGKDQDQLQIDLMYVSRAYRRQGIGRRIMNELSDEAKRRGAKYLYISSTETQSAVNFYHNVGGEITGEVDKELFSKEPEDIHMLKKL